MMINIKSCKGQLYLDWDVYYTKTIQSRGNLTVGPSSSRAFWATLTTTIYRRKSKETDDFTRSPYSVINYIQTAVY